MEIVFNGGQGENFIFDKLMGSIADEVSKVLYFVY